MRKHYLFYVCANIAVVLTLSMPFLGRAEQPIGESEVPEVEASALRLQAQADAEQAADGDVNKLLWFGLGATLPLLGMCIGGAICLSVSPPQPEFEGSGLFYVDIPSGCSGGGAVLPGMLVGLAVGGFIPFQAASAQSIAPPAERLLGKSPEYVEFYTQAYRSKLQSVRRELTVSGGATMFGLLGIWTMLNR